MSVRKISKVLSANDTGETGGHQSGLLIPREPELLSFFPSLDATTQNPRVHLRFVDEAGTYWEFAYIYYNNSLFGGTRNEYRLTRMTKYIRQASLAAGDEVILSRDRDRFGIAHKRVRHVSVSGGVLKLGTGWRVVPI